MRGGGDQSVGIDPTVSRSVTYRAAGGASRYPAPHHSGTCPSMVVGTGGVGGVVVARWASSVGSAVRVGALGSSAGSVCDGRSGTHTRTHTCSARSLSSLLTEWVPMLAVAAAAASMAAILIFFDGGPLDIQSLDRPTRGAATGARRNADVRGAAARSRPVVALSGVRTLMVSFGASPRLVDRAAGEGGQSTVGLPTLLRLPCIAGGWLVAGVALCGRRLGSRCCRPP